MADSNKIKVLVSSVLSPQKERREKRRERGEKSGERKERSKG
jgi:hypothetical protein